MLSDAVAQGHVLLPKTNMKNEMTDGVVKIHNGCVFIIYQIENCTIEDEVVNKV